MAKELHRIFCVNVRNRRKRLGLTQGEVGALLGVSQSRYAEIEGGRFSPSLDLVERVATALQCKAVELVGIEPVPEENAA